MFARGFHRFVAFRYLRAYPKKWSPVLTNISIGLLLDIIVSAILHFKVAHAPVANPFNPTIPSGFFVGTSIAMLVGCVLLPVFGMLAIVRRYFSFYTTVSITGVWVGTMALVFVLSVMGGFESDLRQKILGSNAHIQITKEDGDFDDWRAVRSRIDHTEGVVASTPFALSEVVISANNNPLNVIIKGIDPKSVASVTELVKDLDDRDSINHLEPVDDAGGDTGTPANVPVATKPAGKTNSIDPAPADMPDEPDPIDLSGDAKPASKPEHSAHDEHVDKVDKKAALPQADAGSKAAVRGLGLYAGFDSHIAGAEAPILKPVAGADDSRDVVIRDLPPAESRRTLSLPGVLVGRELAKQIHLFPGKEVQMISPLSDPSNPDANGSPIPFNRDYRVAGVFFTGMYEYDLKSVYVTLQSLQDFLDRGDVVDGIEVRIGDPDGTPRVVAALQTMLGPTYRVQDWKEINRNLFSALKLEKIAMFMVLAIIILVASFSIVGNLIMVVVEKGKEIALLKTLGATDRGVMFVFVIQGLGIGVIGTALGVLFGIAGCLLAGHFGIPINPDVYYIDRLPINVDPSSVSIIALAGLLISIAATLYPAWVASRLRPSTGLRH